jgi:hypothetical protein
MAYVMLYYFSLCSFPTQPSLHEINKTPGNMTHSTLIPSGKINTPDPPGPYQSLPQQLGTILIDL